MTDQLASESDISLDTLVNSTDVAAALDDSRYDLSEVLEYVRQRPNMDGYVALMVIRQHAPRAYRKIPNGAQAAILASALRAEPSLFGFTWHTGGGEIALKPTPAGKVMLRLKSIDLVPLVRDELLNSTGCNNDGYWESTCGDYARWFIQRQARVTDPFTYDPYNYKKRLALYRRLLSHAPRVTGPPLPAEITDTMVREAQEGVPFCESSTLPDLYSRSYDYSKVQEVITRRPDVSSYHLLMALRLRDLRRYAAVASETRTTVLLCGLKGEMESGRFDDWYYSSIRSVTLEGHEIFMPAAEDSRGRPPVQDPGPAEFALLDSKDTALNAVRSFDSELREHPPVNVKGENLNCGLDLIKTKILPLLDSDTPKFCVRFRGARRRDLYQSFRM